MVDSPAELACYFMVDRHFGRMPVGIMKCTALRQKRDVRAGRLLEISFHSWLFRASCSPPLIVKLAHGNNTHSFGNATLLRSVASVVLIDRLFGGRTQAPSFRPGEAFDFLAHLQADPPHCLHLPSEIKMPGDAFLGIDLTGLNKDRCEIQLSEFFLPKGLSGDL